MFLGLIFLYFLNSLIFTIFNKSLDISLNNILLFRNKSTNLSFALTTTVSNKESLCGSLLRIFTTGNFIKSTFLKLRLFNKSILRFSVLIFFS